MSKKKTKRIPAKAGGSVHYNTKELPFETKALREALAKFLNEKSSLDSGAEKRGMKVGDYKWGIYAFYDYEEEPIYIGQTNEKLRTRIRRHLTNQRTDAVAMNVLDPFEVCYIEVWPLPQYEDRDANDKDAKRYLDALEYAVFQHAIAHSRFQAVLNEKAPVSPKGNVPRLPLSYKKKVIEGQVEELHSHPDVRIARRAYTLSRLAQVISERKVQAGLRKTLLTQAQRLAWLAEQRYVESPKADSTDEEEENNSE